MEEQMDMGMAPELETVEVEAPAAETQNTQQLPTGDLVDFIREHPGLDARTIAPEVWQAVKQGDTLSRAYDRHELRQLRQSNLQLQRQLGMAQARNAVRQQSLGSMRSTGGGQAADSFLTGFNEE